LNKRIDYSNIGGFPLDEDVLDFMQQSYRSAFGSIAQLCGNKVIITGVEVAGGNVSNGWIVYNGELIPFVGGVANTYVVISETVTAALFEDDSSHDIEFTKIAQCGAVGDFLFSELTRLSYLQNVWVKNDLKQVYLSNVEIAAKFDINGYGLDEYKGWRKLSSAYPSSAGKFLVNQYPGGDADGDFYTCGQTGGEKKHTLTKAEFPPHEHTYYEEKFVGTGSGTHGGDGSAWVATAAKNTGNGSADGLLGQSHNNVPPYFTVLTLIKL